MLPAHEPTGNRNPQAYGTSDDVVVPFNRAARRRLVRLRIWGSQPETATSLDLTALLELLGYTPDEYVSICHDAGGWRTAVVKVADAAEHFATVPDTANIYFGVNPTAGPARTGEGRGTAEDVTRLSSLWADLDIKSGGCPDTATAQAIIDDLSELLGARPAVITHSGNGLHPYWPISDGKADTATLTALVNRWGRLVKAVAKRHGAKADSVFDLPRVLRAPGSFNCKAATNGHGSIPVRTVPDSGRPLTLAKIDERLSNAGVYEAPDDHEHRTQVSNPADWEAADETCNYVRAWIEGIPDDRPNGGRHQWLLSQAVRFVCAARHGCIAQVDYDTAAQRLQERMIVLRTETGEGVPELEVPGAFEYGIDKAAEKTDAEVSAELGGHEHDGDNGTNGKRVLKWLTGNDIRDDVPEWAMTHNSKGCMQRGTLVLFAGRPGAGKSTGGRWFAASYTNGTIEGCFYGEPQNVAYIASEESLEFMVKPSLRAHGADMGRMYFPRVEVDGEEVRLSSKDDEAVLTKELVERDIPVLFVDPVMSAIGSKVDINKNNEVRACIEPWARIARAINGLVICIVHLTKAPGGDVVAAINGSSAFGEVARAVIAFAKDQQSTDGIRVLSQEKNNAGTEDLALEYVIESYTVETDAGKSAEVGRFVIKGPSERHVSEVLQVDPKDRNIAQSGTKMCEVVEIMRLMGKPVKAADIASGAHISTTQARVYLNRLAEAGLIAKVGRGVYEYRQ